MYKKGFQAALFAVAANDTVEAGGRVGWVFLVAGWVFGAGDSCYVKHRQPGLPKGCFNIGYL